MSIVKPNVMLNRHVPATSITFNLSLLASKAKSFSSDCAVLVQNPLEGTRWPVLSARRGPGSCLLITVELPAATC